jgi:hypothetical protein
MRAGQFDYHTIDERSVDVDVSHASARLVGRIIIEATVYGTRSNWPLQLDLGYARTAERWTALRSVATTW